MDDDGAENLETRKRKQATEEAVIEYFLAEKKARKEEKNDVKREEPKIKGVSFVRCAQRNNESVLIWKSRKTIGGETFNLGNFESQAEAAVAYELKTKVRLFIEIICFSYLIFPI